MASHNYNVLSEAKNGSGKVVAGAKGYQNLGSRISATVQVIKMLQLYPYRSYSNCVKGGLGVTLGRIATSRQCAPLRPCRIEREPECS